MELMYISISPENVSIWFPGLFFIFAYKTVFDLIKTVHLKYFPTRFFLGNLQDPSILISRRTYFDLHGCRFIPLNGVATPSIILNGKRGQVAHRFKCISINFSNIMTVFWVKINVKHLLGISTINQRKMFPRKF